MSDENVQERLSSEKLIAILAEFDRVDELSEVQFRLGVAANLLLTAKQPDPELYLAHYVETDLGLQLGLYSRTVCDLCNKRYSWFNR